MHGIGIPLTEHIGNVFRERAWNWQCTYHCNHSHSIHLTLVTITICIRLAETKYHPMVWQEVAAV